MKKLIPLALLALHAPAFADDVYDQDGYFGIHYSMLNQETDSDDIEPGAFQTRFGVQVNPYVALEGRLGYGIDDDELSEGGYTVNIDPEWLVGAYVKLGLDRRQPVAPYVLFGHSTATAEVTTEFTTSTLLGSVSSRESEEVTASDPSYGAGVDINLSENAALYAEWVQLDDDDDFDLTTINLGFISRF
ncbi:MAG: outer membrane beta-barrel protein [Alcanivorax sediminis]|nr:outer membrane beta-barrel protein [Alcanivorax sediminis]